MKVLLIGLGSRGDVQPLLMLGQELARRDHEVTLAVPPDFQGWVATHGLQALPVAEEMRGFIQRNRAMTEQHPVKAFPAQLKLLQNYLTQQTVDLLSREIEADVVVSGGLGFGGKLLAAKLGVPYVYCWYTLTAVGSAAYPPPFVPVFGMPRLANEALWRGFTVAFQLTVGRTMNELRRRTGLPPDHDGWRGIHAHHVLLAQDSVMGDLPGDAKGDVVQVPAIVPRRQDAGPLSDLLERFLRGAGESSADASPVVYIGFGSMPSVDRKQVESAARELWEQHGARVILQSMHAEDVARDLPDGVFAVEDVDHVSLFPRVDLIVHHGGAGTTASALRSGVPQLVVPHVLDQFFHGRRVAELGVGPEPVPKAKLSAAAIAAALKDRFKYWAKAQSVRASIEADGGAADAAQYLERLVKSGAR